MEVIRAHQRKPFVVPRVEGWSVKAAPPKQFTVDSRLQGQATEQSSGGRHACPPPDGRENISQTHRMRSIAGKLRPSATSSSVMDATHACAALQEKTHERQRRGYVPVNADVGQRLADGCPLLLWVAADSNEPGRLRAFCTGECSSVRQERAGADLPVEHPVGDLFHASDRGSQAYPREDVHVVALRPSAPHADAAAATAAPPCVARPRTAPPPPPFTHSSVLGVCLVWER